MKPLAEARDGEMLKVVSLVGDDLTVMALRFGIDEGALIKVVKNIRGGPVIISKNHLEIAIGRDIAKSLSVEPAP